MSKSTKYLKITITETWFSVYPKLPKCVYFSKNHWAKNKVSNEKSETTRLDQLLATLKSSVLWLPFDFYRTLLWGPIYESACLKLKNSDTFCKPN